MFDNLDDLLGGHKHVSKYTYLDREIEPDFYVEQPNDSEALDQLLQMPRVQRMMRSMDATHSMGFYNTCALLYFGQIVMNEDAGRVDRLRMQMLVDRRLGGDGYPLRVYYMVPYNTEMGAELADEVVQGYQELSQQYPGKRSVKAALLSYCAMVVSKHKSFEEGQKLFDQAFELMGSIETPTMYDRMQDALVHYHHAAETLRFWGYMPGFEDTYEQASAELFQSWHGLWSMIDAAMCDGSRASKHRADSALQLMLDQLDALFMADDPLIAGEPELEMMNNIMALASTCRDEDHSNPEAALNLAVIQYWVAVIERHVHGDEGAERAEDLARTSMRILITYQSFSSFIPRHQHYLQMVRRFLQV